MCIFYASISLIYHCATRAPCRLPPERHRRGISDFVVDVFLGLVFTKAALLHPADAPYGLTGGGRFHRVP